MEILLGAIEKVRFAIDAVEDLEGIHFPHDDARDALLLLKQALQNTLSELESLDGETKPSIVRSYCVQATTNIADTLEGEYILDERSSCAEIVSDRPAAT